MAYRCYLGGVLMPETPSQLKLSIKGKNTTVMLLNEGEINILKKPGLTEISLPLCFPMLTGEHAPTYYLNLLEELKAKQEPTQFILTRDAPDGKLLFDTNITVSLEDYEVQENAENGLDINVSVKLKQYREYSTKTVKIQQQPARKKTTAKTTTAPAAGGSGGAKPAAVNEKIAANDKVKIVSGAVYGGLATTRGMKVPSYVIGKWYTVSQIATHHGEEESLIKEIFSWVAVKYLQKEGTTTTTATTQTERSAATAPKASTYTTSEGDTAWIIAKKFLGDGEKYVDIMLANQGVLSNPGYIPAGTVVKIP